MNRYNSAFICGSCPTLDVLCVVEGYIPTVDIAIVQPFDWLQEKGYITYDVVIVHDVTEERIAVADIILFVRGADPLNASWLDLALQKEKRILYLLDDNFFGLSKETPVGRYYSRPNVMKTITRLLTVADLSILGSPLLMEAMPVPRERVVCLPFVYPHFVEPIKPCKDKTILGYFGTAGHRDDFIRIVPALRKIMANNPETYLEIYGFTSLPGMEDFHNRVSFAPYEDNYRRFMQSISFRGWRIGLAPLIDTPSNRCKTDVKYRDYSAYGLPTVYSKVEPYISRIRNGENGLLAGTNQEWVQALETLIHKPELCREIGRNALLDVQTNNSVKQIASLWITEVFFRLVDLPRNPYIAEVHSWQYIAKVYCRVVLRKFKAVIKRITPAPLLHLYRRIRWGTR